jgi:hypothetical protein
VRAHLVGISVSAVVALAGCGDEDPGAVYERILERDEEIQRVADRLDITDRDRKYCRALDEFHKLVEEQAKDVEYVAEKVAEKQPEVSSDLRGMQRQRWAEVAGHRIGAQAVDRCL